MTFLQPEILWGLPLVLLPVIIHLINRLRHRPQPWAAMRFLVAATRSSTSQARLRQWLILLFRTLAVLMLLLFLGRPLTGGWLGWSVAAAPDVIVLLLDRSVSMEAAVPGGTGTRREQALAAFARAAEPFAGRSQFVLLDSARRTVQPLARLADLQELPDVAATDTAADLPGLLQTAVNWLAENRTGTAELWLASDAQRSNWQPDDERWSAVAAQLGELSQRVRVRLLSFAPDPAPDTSATLLEAVRRDRGDRAELVLALDLQRHGGGTAPATVPVTLQLNGVAAQQEVVLEGQSLRWRPRLDLGAAPAGGWGYVELPADANRRNNRAYFVYGPPAVWRAAVVSEEPRLGQLLQLAVQAAPPGVKPAVTLPGSGEVAAARWENEVLLLWQAPLPQGAAADAVQRLVESGGTVLFLPPGRADAGSFAGGRWGAVQDADAGQLFRVERWEEQEGPLAKTEEGFSLPVGEVEFRRRQALTGGGGAALAQFTDGAPLLTRQTLGRGQVLFLTTLPQREWSGLAEGTVLVPLVQRLLQAGSRRLTQAALLTCGELSAPEAALNWTALEGGGRDPQFEAGVYREGERLVAVNRPGAENEPETLAETELAPLFGNVPFRLLTETGDGGDRLQGEVWRLFLLVMLLFLLAESWLILPARPVGDPGALPPPARAAAPERMGAA